MKATRAGRRRLALFRGEHSGYDAARICLEFFEAGQVAELAGYLEVVEVDPDSAGQCRCMGSQLLEFRPSGEQIALHHAVSLRWPGAWKWDAPLKNGRGLAEWLAARELEGAARLFCGRQFRGKHAQVELSSPLRQRLLAVGFGSESEDRQQRLSRESPY